MLSELSRMSVAIGGRPDYVQGGGGNTSVKLDGGLMAIKASGYRLSQVTERDGFAVVEVATLKDVTAEKGYEPRRPSVEAGFHALLGRYVLHTHPVYVNFALCSQSGERRVREIMGDLCPYITVPYIDPGAALSEAFRERLQPDTRAVFMENHGLVVTGGTADDCLSLHEEINRRFASAYGVDFEEFARFSRLIGLPLYPDQQVYLTLTEVQAEVLAAVMLIHRVIEKNGEQARPMDAKAMEFIAGWESEAYRKTVLS